MTDEWRKAVQNLSDSERKMALESLLEDAKEPEVGVIRQILGEDRKPLTEKQKHVYEKYIEPALVEKCGAPGCSHFSLAGETYCPTCAIKYRQ